MIVTDAQTRPELGFYALAGQPDSSRDILQEVRDAEAMRLGTAFISERDNLKETAMLCGAAGAVSERIKLQTATTDHNTRQAATDRLARGRCCTSTASSTSICRWDSSPSAPSR
jgi:alkanesulfonate monooxygenase SsuD/methylene tetrahydromethanopterin reductase-like flavin-dependent oxidoreductase (luciferase family)